MKIGILTFHRPLNYGALLQAIALRSYLSDMGHDVYYVDYWPEYHKDSYRVFNKTIFKTASLKEKITIIFKSTIFGFGRKKRINAFSPFIEEYINPYCQNYHSGVVYDLCLYGSDQIWRNFKSLGNHQDFTYFGINQIKASVHASFAASMGNIIVNDNDIPKLKEGLSRFKMIGVREQNIYSLLTEWGFDNIHLNIDPTLLLCSQKWEKILKPHRLIKEPYLVTYSLREAFDKGEIEKFADKHHLRIVRIGSSYSLRDRHNEFNVTSPYDFVSLIKYADFCMMASFHGLVFSLIFQRQFFVSFATAADRAKTLLGNLGLQDRLIEPFSMLPEETHTIDYSEVEKKLDVLKASSQVYLNNLIEIH